MSQLEWSATTAPRLTIEVIRSGRVSFLVSSAGMPIARMWAQASPVQLQEEP